MKQSTKLLSLVLALVMAFSCLSVVGSAKPADLTQGNMTYDSVDDAIISGELGATILLNYLEATVMPDLGVIDLSILGKLDLTSVNNLTSSFYTLLGKGVLGLAEDTRNLTTNKEIFNGLTREKGDLNVLYGLFNYFGAENTLKTLKKVPYGLLTNNGIGVGTLLNGVVKMLVDLDEINGILTNIEGLVTDLVFDLLIYGSYGHDKDAEEGGVTSDYNTVDKVLKRALGGLLTLPQDYTVEGNGESAKKEWNLDSKVMPSIAALGITVAMDYFSLDGVDVDADNGITAKTDSIFNLLDKIAPFAIYDLGISPLNNNLKKALMEAVEADIDEIPVDKLPADAKKAFEVGAVDANGKLIPAGKESYVTYISYDKMFKSAEDKEWYYTTLETEVVGEENKGDEVVEITEKVRKYFKVNMAVANDFAKLINFDWNITAPKPTKDDNTGSFVTTPTGAINEIDYASLIKSYGSIAQSLNHLVYIVAKNALSDKAVKDFNKVVIGDENANQDVWVDGATSAKSPDGKSTVFVYNLERIVKFLLAEYADRIFGADSEYVAWEYSDVKDMTIVELVAHIGPTFFEDVMPQLIIPKDKNGRAAFHKGVEILEFGALVIREFMTEITPNVNYDADIFGTTLTSASGRQFKDYGTTAKDDWFNLILNMGMDIAYTYLNQLTNFNTDYPKHDITEARWQGMLEAVITWGVDYVGDDSAGVLQGINPTEVAKQSGPFNKLSYILNKILPLGFINGCSSASHDFDVSILFSKVKDLFQNFNLDAIVSLFGRNTAAANRGNILAQGDVISTVLTLAGDILTLVLGANILIKTDSVSSILKNDNLSNVIVSVFTQLKKIAPTLLPTALPVACKLITDLGGEQELGTPSISLSNREEFYNGRSYIDDDKNVERKEFTIINGSTGLWRGYKTSASATEHSKDNQYGYKIKSIAAYNYDGTPSSYVTDLKGTDNELEYGEKSTVSYYIPESNPIPTSGVVQRFDVTYSVTNEDGVEMTKLDENGNAKVMEFTTSKYVFFTYNGSNEGNTASEEYVLCNAKVSVKEFIYINNDPETVIESIEATPVASMSKDKTNLGSYKVGVSSKQTKQGIYYGESPLYGTNDKKAYSADFYLDVTDEATAKSYAATSGNYVEFAVAYKASSNGDNTTTRVTFYDGKSLAKLSSLVGDEASAMRKEADYHTDDAEYYADRLLRTQNVDDERLIETTSEKTAWIDDDKNEYAETQLVEGKTATKYYKDAQGKDTKIVEAMTGIVVKDGKNIPVKKVTVLKGSDVWSRYESALENGIMGAWQVWNLNSVYDFAARYKALYIASAELDQLKLTDEELAALGTGDNIDNAVNTLEAKLDAVEAQYSDTKDYTDYRMYRWNRYNDVREDAQDIINAKKAASFTSPDSKYFPYTWVSQTDVNGIIRNEDNEAYIGAYVGGTDGLNFISELLEDYSDEEMAQREEDLKNAKIHYANIDALEVAQAQNLLNRIPGRLLTREHGVVKTHLINEIASAIAMIGSSDDDGNYTYRSWAKYANALEDAIAVRDDANSSQMEVFDAKWELLCCRNELVLADFEADYSELEELINQATLALENQNLYDNTAKELGQVLAELGLGYEVVDDETGREELITVALENGEKVDLFPGSAHYVNHEPYSKDDQDIVDRKATELKEALARLKFKKTNVELDGTFEDVEIKAADPDNDIEAEIISNVARIDAMQLEDTVKDLFNATDDSTMEIVNKVVSNDIYSVEKYDENGDLIPFKGFVGTNATLTFYADIDGYYVPVATVRIVVDGDVNGDGVVDAIDANLTNLVATEHADLDGCFFIAGNLDSTALDEDGNQKVNALDYSEVVDIALAS